MFCNNPFTKLHVMENAYTTCCYGWVEEPEDFTVRGEYENPWDFWNHEKFKRLRRIWLADERKHSFPVECGPCGKRAECELNELILSNYLEHMENGPQIIGFANDLSCNLHCWTCRSKPIMEKKQKKNF